MVAGFIAHMHVQSGDFSRRDALGWDDSFPQEPHMVAETKDRRINTDAKITNDGGKRLPHERDESPDGHDKAPRGVMRQAADDLSQGLVDTDLHGTPGMAPAGGAKAGGQARPQKDAAKGMRHHDSK
jgi:hypothetical protein